MLTIAWDVDDVLNNLMYDWFYQEWKNVHLDCTHQYDDITINPPHELLGVSRETYLQSLDEYRQDFMMQLQPNRDVLEWFGKYGTLYRHLVLTATPISTAPQSAFWVMKHFGQWVRGFHFVPSLREGQSIAPYEQSKQEFLDWIGKVDVFIDDNPHNIAMAQLSGIRSYLVKRPWNQGMELIDVLAELT